MIRVWGLPGGLMEVCRFSELFARRGSYAHGESERDNLRVYGPAH